MVGTNDDFNMNRDFVFRYRFVSCKRYCNYKQTGKQGIEVVFVQYFIILKWYIALIRIYHMYIYLYSYIYYTFHQKKTVKGHVDTNIGPHVPTPSTPNIPPPQFSTVVPPGMPPNNMQPPPQFNNAMFGGMIPPQVAANQQNQNKAAAKGKDCCFILELVYGCCGTAQLSSFGLGGQVKVRCIRLTMDR